MSIREGKHRKPIHLAAHFPGGPFEFESFVHLAQTAERGLFDFVFLDDGLGRPDTFTVLAALSGVTERIGLVGTVDTTFNEPFEVARQFATLDHLSEGRAGWNLVTTSDAFTGKNFRRGDYLDHADRYRRADEFLEVARKFWDSWDRDAIVADDAAGIYVDPGRVHAVHHHGPQFDVRGMATLPAGPQGHPVLVQAIAETDRSSEGRDFGAAQADAVFTLHSALVSGKKYYADVKRRAATQGRDPNRLKVFLAVTFVLGDTAADAADRARYTREQQVTPQAAIEQFVGTAAHIAAEIDRHVQSDACDGFILVPPLTPRGLDEFVDKVVPLLQERGAFRTEYRGDTLREHLNPG